MNRRPAIIAVATASIALLAGCTAGPDPSDPLDEAGQDVGGGAPEETMAGGANAGGGEVGFDPGAGAGGATHHIENLIPNGDFEQGNAQFSSDYAYDPSSGWEQGVYKVGAEGASWNSYWVGAGDHSSGSGLMLLANGKETPDRVWFLAEPVAVEPHTTYYFEAWVMAECCDEDDSAELSFYANDELLGTRTAVGVGTWIGLSTSWDSGAASSVTLKLVNANTEEVGNDFAIDDVFLGTESTVPPPN